MTSPAACASSRPAPGVPCRGSSRSRDHRFRAGAGLALLVVSALALGACGGSSDSTSTSSSVPGTVPAVHLVNLSDGSPADLAAFRGKPLIVNLWASWCTPCRTEMPVFEATQQRLGDKVQIVGITDDPNRDAAKQAAAATKVTYPLLVDTDEKLQSALGVTGLPATIFLDKNGAILENHAGILDAAGLDETIGRLYGPQ